MVDFVAYEPHFLDHLAPMWHALPAAYRGKFIIRAALRERAMGYGLDVSAYRGERSGAIGIMQSRKNLVVAASSGDLDTVHKAGCLAVFTQHGAGQSFDTLHSSYAGWKHHKNVIMFLHPGDHPAQRDLVAYKRRIPVRVVGCPKMDAWHSGANQQPANDLPVVVFSTHWDCKVVPETRSAFYHMLPGLEQLVQGHGVHFNLVGHCHPRMARTVRPEYARLGIRYVPDFADVMAQGDLYVMDHMSTLYEFASAGQDGHGRPVVVMNCPHYRKDVNHGLRFWDAAGVGLNVWKPARLLDTVLQALEDPEEVQKKRHAAVRMVYKYTDAKAAQRAATAIVEAAERHATMIHHKTFVVQQKKEVHKMNQKISIQKPDYSKMKQVPLVAINRLQNFRRGFTPAAGGMQPGIKARGGSVFYTDASHASELVLLGHARHPYEHEAIPAFSSDGEQMAPATAINAANMPVWDKLHIGAGYYDITEDGHVIQQVRGKGAADAILKQKAEDWKEANGQN